MILSLNDLAIGVICGPLHVPVFTRVNLFGKSQGTDNIKWPGNWSIVWPFVCSNVYKRHMVGKIFMFPQWNTSFCAPDNRWMLFQDTNNNELWKIFRNRPPTLSPDKNYQRASSQMFDCLVAFCRSSNSIFCILFLWRFCQNFNCWNAAEYGCACLYLRQNLFYKQ